MFGPMLRFKKIVFSAFALSVAFGTGAFAESLPSLFVDCPAGEEQVRFSRVNLSYRTSVADPLDPRPARILPLGVPECTENRFPLYRLFTPAEGVILDKLVESEAYREATETMTAWARVLWIEEQLNTVPPKTRVDVLSRDLRGMDDEAVLETYRAILPDLVRAVESDDAWGAGKQESLADERIARASAMGQVAFMLFHIGQEDKGKTWLKRARKTLGSRVFAEGARDTSPIFWRIANDRIRVTELCFNSPAKYRDELCSVGGVRQFASQVAQCLFPHEASLATSRSEVCGSFTGFSNDPHQLAAEINALRKKWPDFRELFELRVSIKKPVSCDVRDRLGLNCVSPPPPSKKWMAYKTFFPDMKPVRTMSTFGYSMQGIARQLANCLEAFDKQACQKFGDPQKVLENGKAVDGFIAAVNKARAVARRRFLWKKAVCDAKGRRSSPCSFDYMIGMPDTLSSTFPELALERVNGHNIQRLARCAVSKAMRGADYRYRKSTHRKCEEGGWVPALEAKLRQEVPDFDRVYASALSELVFASARTIGRDLASLSLLGGYVEKPREVIESERHRLVAFFPEADAWIAKQERIAIEDETRLR